MPLDNLLLTTQSAMKQWALQSPFSCALITPQQSYTWQQLSQKVNDYAYQLKLAGVTKGDVVTLVGKNQPETLFVYLACCELGAIGAITMPQPRAKLQQKLDCLYQQNQTRYLWFSEETWQRFTELEQIEIHKDCKVLTLEHQNAVLDRETVTSIDPNTLASIIFTSGSTGVPKAVTHNYKQHFASADGLLQVFSYTTEDTWLLSLPMYHVSGMAIVYRWLSAGGQLKVGSGDISFDIQDVTHASLVATQLNRLIDSEQPLTLSRVLLGGSHIPSVLLAKCARKGIDTWVGYGMTETASTVTAKKVNENSSSGKLLPNRDLKIVNQRIFVSGKTLACGYFYQGEVTPLVDESGWFDSKDLGVWCDEELTIIGRADNQFISGGENIHCEEIEAQLNQHPDIIQAFIVPVKDREFGYRPVALLESLGSIKSLNVEIFLQQRLEKFKWPKAYYPIPAELINKGMKVSREELRSWLAEQIS
ncbi:o-succinylbenzoate--CoA ligase [Vibrio sp. ZSDE26]|uniref:O-succinylbenzoate--CoA ligase n=1 Tax=Vibrio amylolyticus TaxID=2847292 RepID=A0A9X1XI65_9VIBR|nr:o-succinylbenzoate--CoA ligase [Vibrio amylolyticus]MCK6262063.1 o-succinylbenzoate--CoA ligase [Vibrio amylolyticus]